MGRKISEEHKRKIIKNLDRTGKKATPETIAKLRASHLGQIPWNKGLSSWSKGKHLSAEHRRKISISNKGKSRNSRYWLGKNLDESTKQKIRNARLHQTFPQKDTKPERLLQQALVAEQIQFETHHPITGQPDIFIKPNICIFVDGDYWHNLENVKKHDVIVTETLEKDNYIVLRFWEHEIYNELRNVVVRIIDKI